MLNVVPLKGSYFLPKAKFIYPQLANWAAIHAVVKPFYRGRLAGTMRGYPQDQVGTVLYQMFHQRHQQLLALRNLGWKTGEGNLRTYCLPGIAEFDVKLTSCGLRAWCPFCWARCVVAPIFWRLLTALYFDEGSLSWCKTPRHDGVLEVVQTADMSFHHATEAILGSLKWNRQFIADSIPGTLGSVLINTIEPTEDSWRVVTRLLALVSDGFDIDNVMAPGPATIVEYHRPPVRKNRVAKIVGRICSYPAGLLEGEPELVKQVLDARRQSRLVTSYGVLRNDKLARFAKGQRNPYVRKSEYDSNSDSDRDRRAV